MIQTTPIQKQKLTSMQNNNYNNNNNNKNRYFKYATERYKMINKNKYTAFNKKLYYSTHLLGPHIEFYNSPSNFNKVDLHTNYVKFQRKISKSIGNLLECEKYNVYLNKMIVTEMLKQINTVLTTPDLYWQNLGFDSNVSSNSNYGVNSNSNSDVSNIKKTYQMYKLFLESYADRIINTKTTKTEKMYQIAICDSLGMKVLPKDLQLFGIIMVKQICEEIKKIGFDKNQKSDTIKTSSELVSETMKLILSIYDKIKDSCQNLVIPEPHKIKIKALPLLREVGIMVSDRILYLNFTKPEIYTKDLLELICLQNVIPGKIMLKMNANSNLLKIDAFNDGIASYFQYKHSNNKLLCLVDQLINATKIIVDTGLHSKDVDIVLSIDESVGLVKTIARFVSNVRSITDEEITNMIMQILAMPAKESASGFGYFSIKKVEELMLLKKYTESDICEMLYTTPLPHDLLMSYVENYKN